MTAPAFPAAIRRSLRETFGVRELREGQQDVISRVLAGRDTLALMPSGAGKSLCYQLPALHLDGLTVVVSPLIALMKDQVERLADAGIDAEQLNSARPEAEQRAALQRIADGTSDIVFATPERLTEAEFLQTLRQRRVALVVVDEAHCISQWGHDFRPAYLEIATALHALKDPPLLALTATAVTDVVEDIRQRLDRPRMHVVDTGLYRANLQLQVARCVREDEKFDRLREALSRAHGSGIVYAATVKACEDLHRRLVDAGESVTLYHGRLPRAERDASQDRFMKGETRVMIATNAFGMGVDKPDIRFVVHWQMPGSLEAYYQEAGRAGRDGRPADCALLYLRQDRQVQQFFLARRYPTQDDLQRVVDALESAEGDAPSSIATLQERLPEMPRTRVAVTLSMLRDARIAAVDRSRAWRRRREQPADAQRLAALAADYVERAERDHEALERMVFYAQTGFCRWRVLLDYFDEPLPFADQRCGVCDNCLRPAVAQPAATTEERPAAPPVAAPAFASGASVRVPRYGEGRVERATADEVTVQFADGRSRTFVASYVQAA